MYSYDKHITLNLEFAIFFSFYILYKYSSICNRIC